MTHPRVLRIVRAHSIAITTPGVPMSKQYNKVEKKVRRERRIKRLKAKGREAKAAGKKKPAKV